MSNETPKLYATWSISLDVECPKCEDMIDITNADDFWCNGMQAAEHDTPRTTDYEVTCPNCAHEFVVDFEY